MSLAREILPGRTYLISRRCIGRQFLLRPSPFTNLVVWYCIAVAAKKYGLLIHQITAMSNHYHIILTDPRGELPEFMRYCNEFIAKTLNVHFGRWECFFAPGSYSAVILTDRDSVLQKMVYSITNPVDAILVTRSTMWPGICTQASDVGRTITVGRPKTLFRKDGPLPEKASLTLVPPPKALVGPADAFLSELAVAVAEKEAELREAAAQRGQRFLGPKLVLAQNPTDTPQTREPRRQLSPRVAGRDRERRIEALLQIKEFLAAYREAWLKLKAGVRKVLFPAGTYALVRYRGVRCAPAG